MSGDVDDVVRAAHDPEVPVLILKTSVRRFVITWIRIEVRLLICCIVVPQRRKTTRRQRQLDDNVADLVISYFCSFIVEHTHVITRNRFAARTGLYRKQTQAGEVGSYGPASFRLPPMIDNRNAQLALGPVQRIRVAALASQKQSAEVFQIVFSNVITGIIFTFNGAK